MDNVSLFYFVFNFSRKFPLLNGLMIFGADYLILLTLVLVIILAIARKSRERKSLLLILPGTVVALLLIQIIHLFIFEPRPFIVLPINPLIKHTADASFPSTHTTIMSVIAFAYIFFGSKFSLLFLLLLLWVGLARIYVGIHYPVDIAGGILVGFLAVYLVWLVTRLLTKRL